MLTVAVSLMLTLLLVRAPSRYGHDGGLWGERNRSDSGPECHCPAPGGKSEMVQWNGNLEGVAKLQTSHVTDSEPNLEFN